MTDTETKNVGWIELCRGVHTTQTSTHIAIGFCVHLLLSVSVSVLGLPICLGVGQRKRTTKCSTHLLMLVSTTPWQTIWVSSIVQSVVSVVLLSIVSNIPPTYYKSTTTLTICLRGISVRYIFVKEKEFSFQNNTHKLTRLSLSCRASLIISFIFQSSGRPWSPSFALLTNFSICPWRELSNPSLCSSWPLKQVNNSDRNGCRLNKAVLQTICNYFKIFIWTNLLL